MYEILLPVHNLLRWIFLGAALYAIFRAMKGMSGGAQYTPQDKTAGTILVASAHTQLLLGLILFFISPAVQTAMASMGTSMKDPALRLILVEHPLTMILGVVLIQVGSIKAKKAYADADKHKRSLIFFGIGLLLILSRIPWGTAPMMRF